MRKLGNKNHTFQHTYHNTQKGITLVALVITIILLLILTGVAINMAINSDGLFGKANESAEEWNGAVKNEQIEMEETLIDLESVSPTPVRESTTLPEGWDLNKVDAVATGVSGKAPIPKGFVVSEIEGENTIGKGLVIYQVDKTTAEADGFWTDTDDNGYLTCQTMYNQYVWIPVADINQMVMCKKNNKNNDGTICNIVLQEDGTLRCMEHNAEEENTTDLCGRLYGEYASPVDENDKYGIYTARMNFANRSQVWGEIDESVTGTFQREPDITVKYDTEENTKGLDIFKNQMINDFKKMAISVAKYGGFYVARYEAGENGASLKNQKVVVAGDESNYNEHSDNTIAGNMWYGLYNAVHQKIKLDEANILQNHMIYGCQYDQIINFIGEEAQIGHRIRHDQTYQERTGANELDVMNNIYNLEGNNIEWTAQVLQRYIHGNDAGGLRIVRGGDFGGVGYTGSWPASNAFNPAPTNTTNYATTRSVICLY